MTKHMAKIVAAGGEGPEINLFGSEYVESLASVGPTRRGGGEGPEINMFGGEYLQSPAPKFGGEAGDYGIWTSLPGPTGKKAA